MKRLGQSNFELSFDELLANVALLLAYQAYGDYFKHRDYIDHFKDKSKHLEDINSQNLSNI